MSWHLPLSPGSKLAQYEIIAPLGAGGMGNVYRARDVRLGREVALKVMADHVAADPEMRRRFEIEARAVAGLSHPCIMRASCSLLPILFVAPKPSTIRRHRRILDHQ